MSDFNLSSVMSDFTPPEVTPPSSPEPDITTAKAKAVLPYLPWINQGYIPPEYAQYAGFSYAQIAARVGLTAAQVADLHAQYIVATKPEPLAPESV